jgi:hypothetical protein
MKLIISPTRLMTIFIFQLSKHSFLLATSLHFLSKLKALVGQLLWCNINSTNVVISILLHLYDDGTLQHIDLPHILPQPIIHPSCVNSCEVVMICKVAVVPVCCTSFFGLHILGHRCDGVQVSYSRDERSFSDLVQVLLD